MLYAQTEGVYVTEGVYTDKGVYTERGNSTTNLQEESIWPSQVLEKNPIQPVYKAKKSENKQYN